MSHTVMTHTSMSHVTHIYMSHVYMQALSPVFAQEEGEIIIAREYDAEYDRAWLRLFRQVL